MGNSAIFDIQNYIFDTVENNFYVMCFKINKDTNMSWPIGMLKLPQITGLNNIWEVKN